MLDYPLNNVAFKRLKTSIFINVKKRNTCLQHGFFLPRPLIFISGFNLFDRYFSESGLRLVSVQRQYF